MAPPPPPPWIAIIVILSLVLFCLIFLIICYKCTDMKRILAPRVKKAEDNIDQYFSVMSHQEVKKEEEAEDLTLNPVVQARMHIDTTHAEGQKKHKFAAGALRRLNIQIGGDKKHTAADALKNLDRKLKKEEKEAVKAAGGS